MGMEIDTFLFDLSESCQREHLKSAGIGQDRLIPYHKLMQTTQLPNNFIARSYMKMIGVGQLNLGSDCLQILGRYSALDRSYRSYIHKYRCLYSAMHGLQHRPLCSSIFCYNLIHNYPFYLHMPGSGFHPPGTLPL